MKTVALIVGVILLAMGVASFVPGLSPDGRLLGILAMDAVKGVLFVLTGLAGVAIGMSHRRSLPPPPGSAGNDLRFWM